MYSFADRGFPNILLLFVLIFFITACKNEGEFFTKGRKVESGFIWEKTEVSADTLLKDKKVTLLFSDDFNRADIGTGWDNQGGSWRVLNGAVHSPSAENRNLVLKGTALPEHAVVEFTLWSETPYVDIKFNLYGDGGIHDHGDGYSFIMGGWKGQLSVLTRLDEHERQRIEDRQTRFEPSRKYRVKVIRLGGDIYWFVDNEILLARRDPNPLSVGAGYRYLSFANWRSLVYFDDVKVSRID